MSAIKVDIDFLRQFENNLDPIHPDGGGIPAFVLGYGEISTVLEISTDAERGLAFKRMPMFLTEREAENYERLYHEYIHILKEFIGIQVVESEITHIVDKNQNRVVVYIIQEKLSSNAIANNAIHHLKPDDIQLLVTAILKEISKVFEYNHQHQDKLAVGIDGQISNWGIANFDPEEMMLREPIDLVYFDTSSPFVCRDCVEQLDPELFLRSAPSFLVWILRLLFLEDVMTRYYDCRKVCIDLIANFYKEGRAELIPDLVIAANEFLSRQDLGVEILPLTVREIKAYYREDAWIWRLYLAFRKIDRSLYRLMGKHYPYILPDKIQR